MKCPSLRDERNVFFDGLFDLLDVAHSVALFQLTDTEIIAQMLGGTGYMRDISDENMYENFILYCSMSIQKMFSIYSSPWTPVID